MNQVPHITKLLAELQNIASADWKKWGIPSATAADFVTWAQSRARHTINEVLIEMTEANAEQEQYITAEEARALEAQNVEWFAPDANPPAWFNCKGVVIIDCFRGTNEPIKYRAINQPKLIPLDWKDVPVGVAVVYKGKTYIFQSCKNKPYAMLIMDVSAIYPALGEFELAPASEQPWIAVQDDDPHTMHGKEKWLATHGILIEVHDSEEKYRITGLASGYGYPEQKGEC